MFKNVKSILIRKIFRRDVDKMFSKNIIEITTKITNIYRLTSSNNNALIMRF